MAWKLRICLFESIRLADYRVILMAGRDECFDRLIPLCDELVDVRIAFRCLSLASALRTLADNVRHLPRLRPRVVLTFTITPSIYASLACRWRGIPVFNNVT